MAGLKSNEVVSKEAIEAPLKLAASFDPLLKKVKELGIALSKTYNEFEKSNTGDNVKNTKKLTDEQRELAKVTKQVTVATARQTDEYDEQNKKLIEARTKQQERNKQIKQEIKQVALGLSGAYDKLQKELTETTLKYKDLAAAGKENTKEAKELLAAQNKLDAKLKGIDKSVGQSTRNVGNYTSVWGKFRGLIGGIGAAGVVGALGAAAGKLKSLTDEISRNRKQVVQLTGVYGVAADNITASVQSIADVFGKDFNEVLLATNTLSKEFGINMSEAIDLVSDGFASGSDVNGEYLETIKEYSTQIKSAGISAEDFNRIINTSVKEGIFSDKGIDVIKEATLRLRELPKPTREALDQIGLSSNEIAKSLKDGSQSIFDVIKQVSNRLGELPPQSAEVGKAIADIFGGPGEDAGLRYITLLGDVETGLDDLSEASDGYKKRAQDQLKAQENLNKELAELSKTWEGLGSTIGVFLTKLGTKTVEFFNGLLKPISDTEKAVRDFQTSLNDVTKEELLELKSELEEDPTFFEKLGASISGFGGVATLNTERAVKLANVLQKLDDIRREEEDALWAEVLGTEEENKKITDGFVNQTKDVKESVEDIDLEKQKAKFDDFKTTASEPVDGDLLAENLKMREQKVKESEDLLIEMEKEKAQKRREIAFATAQAVQEIANIGFDFRQEQRDLEIQQIEESAARQLEAAGDDERKKSKIQADADRRTKKLRTEQAKSQKRQAIFNTVINTATSIGQTAATLGFPAAIPFIAIASALGAAQLAAIIARPIPKFNKGTKNTPDTFIAGDGGREIVKTKSGKAFVTPDTDTLYTGLKGAEIIPNRQTEEILGNIEDARMSGVNLINDNRSGRVNDSLGKVIAKGNRELIKTIKNKPSVYVSGRIDYLADSRENMKRQFIEDNYVG